MSSIENENEYCLFCSHNYGEWRVFSQWFPSTFQLNIEGNMIIFKNCEQWMMFQKALLFGDEESSKKILNTNDPWTIKQLGRGVQGYKQDVWDKNKYEIVRQGNYLKFSQSPELVNILLATGNRIIAEASHYDRIWGIGLRPDNPDAHDINKWKGENLLGKVLMDVRTQIRRHWINIEKS